MIATVWMVSLTYGNVPSYVKAPHETVDLVVVCDDEMEAIDNAIIQLKSIVGTHIHIGMGVNTTLYEEYVSNGYSHKKSA